ncbi:hypothetical protein [Bradyrhizobium sp. USDA 4508]
MSNELQQIAVNELRLYGIKPECRPNGRGHIEIVWRACPEKEERVVVVAKTPSDWRSRMNARAEVRKYLRADNVQLATQAKPRNPKQTMLQDALSLPQDVIPIPDQLTALRGELADLTALMVRLLKVAHGTRETVEKVLPKEAPAPVKLSSRSIKIAEYLSLDSWISITALVRDTGLTLKQIQLKLGYLQRLGEISIHQNQVKLLKHSTRRKGRKPRTLHAAATPRRAKKKNGHEARA